MDKLKIEYLPLDSIKPYENNAKEHPQEQIEQIKESIKEFGNIDPIGIWGEENEIVEGHGRYEAAKQLKLKTVPVIRLDNLTDEQRRAYALVHNQLTMNTGWDDVLFGKEVAEIGMDLSRFGIDGVAEEMQEEAEKYTKKVNVPQYEPTGEDVALWECYDTQKTEQLIEDINNSSLSDKQKEFLRVAAYRHTVFNYRKIAEYYANADKEMQELMENSALVIIDYENAMANGYVKLSESIKEMFGDE